MGGDEWLLETEAPKKAAVVMLDRRPLAERSRLCDRGLVRRNRIQIARRCLLNLLGDDSRVVNGKGTLINCKELVHSSLNR